MTMFPHSTFYELEYQKYHAKRLNFAWRKIQEIRPKKTIEVGAFALAFWMRINGHRCDTIGFIEERLLPFAAPNELDIQYDFNEMHKSYLPKCVFAQYDLVVACEVSEHLIHSLDNILLKFSAMAKPGGRLLIQTPNAVALKKRVTMLLGRNPFDLINRYPGGTYSHIREPTIKEIVKAGENIGLTVEQVYCKNYFNYPSFIGRCYELICNLLPKTFHDGITIIFRK